MEKNIITILNYPGSKKRLLEFINNTIYELLPSGKSILDIFSGTSSVAYSLKDKYRVFTNDAEIYCHTIGKALLNNNKINFSIINEEFDKLYLDNKKELYRVFPEVKQEIGYIEDNNSSKLVEFYHNFYNVWQTEYCPREICSKFYLFTTYYSNSYFGIEQAIDIDSIRCAIEKYKGTTIYEVLLACLYYAMKECVFSKDGHMAQPLNIDDKPNILLKRRQKNIYENFIKKISDFESSDFVVNEYDNQAYNATLEDFILSGVLDKVDLIYADPPYTDMQYSRYFHLLETVTKYDYPQISKYRGKVSTGLYRENRFQSPLSQRKNAKAELEKLIKLCAEKNKILVFSYAYPIDLEKEKSDRYTMSIDDLISMFEKHYGKDKTKVLAEPFEHSNNRKSETKKVYEYLIVGIVD